VSTPIPTFVQNSRVGRTFFQIRGSSLAISTPLGDGSFAERAVDLRTIDSDYQPQAVRILALLVEPGIAMLVTTAAIAGLMQLKGLPREVFAHFIEGPIIVFAVALALAIRGARRVEYYLFRDHGKKPAFTIVCEREQREECAAFMASLVTAIEASQSDLPEADRARLVARVESENRALATRQEPYSKWQFAIGCGVLACGLPWLLWLVREDALDFFGFFIELGLCAGGPAFSYFSFQARERYRWWSLVGVVLGAVPIVFYS
jgi:hypothetical protein